jgi:ABC-type phosphate transport system permease subunit
MALLTLPVVIVSVEEAFAPYPAMREASLARAQKWETIRDRSAQPITGIFGGAILAEQGRGVALILFTRSYFLPHPPKALTSSWSSVITYITSTNRPTWTPRAAYSTRQRSCF